MKASIRQTFDPGNNFNSAVGKTLVYLGLLFGFTFAGVASAQAMQAPEVVVKSTVDQIVQNIQKNREAYRADTRKLYAMVERVLVPTATQAVEQVDALRAPVAVLTGGDDSSAAVAAAVEFILEGLHLSKRLNKDASGDSATYRGRT